MAPKVSIEYCVEWNYYPAAAGLAETLKKKLNIDAKLIKSGGGVFEVVANGKLIFSKKKEYRFPEHEEIIESLKGI